MANDELQATILQQRATAFRLDRIRQREAEANEAAANPKQSTAYRGVFKADEEYAAGDHVTYGGSLWIALEDTTASPGGESRDWQLAAKRGALVTKAIQGPRGRRGRCLSTAGAVRSCLSRIQTARSTRVWI